MTAGGGGGGGGEKEGGGRETDQCDKGAVLGLKCNVQPEILHLL